MEYVRVILTLQNNGVITANLLGLLYKRSLFLALELQTCHLLPVCSERAWCWYSALFSQLEWVYTVLVRYNQKRVLLQQDNAWPAPIKPSRRNKKFNSTEYLPDTSILSFVSDYLQFHFWLISFMGDGSQKKERRKED